MSSKLNLFFFHILPMSVKKFKLSFRNIIEEIKNDNPDISTTFSIPENVFKHGKDKTAIGITLYDESNHSQNYKFNVYYGKNSAYVRTDRLSKFVFEIILRNMKNVKIEYGITFKEFDNLGNKDRERLCLINHSDTIKINGVDIDLSSIILDNTIESEIKFNQISVLDLEREIFIVKPIKDKMEYDIEFFIKNKQLLLSFEKHLDTFFGADIFKYKIVRANIKAKFKKLEANGSLDLNRDIDYLNQIFNQNEFLDLEIFWNYSLYRFFIDSEIEYIYLNRSTVKYFIEKIRQIKDKINKENDLPFYEKVRTIHSIFGAFFMPKNPIRSYSDVNNLNIRYIITSKSENNSIIDRSNKFYNKIIEGISEKSAIFPYLLNINSGSGYYKHESFYTFDITNLEMIKSHLRQVYPKVLVFCNAIEGEVAITESLTGGIIINDFYLTNNNNLNYGSNNLPQISEADKDDIAVTICLENLHEASGHKKYALSEQENYSPRKIFNKNNEIKTLEYQGVYVSGDNNNEYILTSNFKKKKGDSGHFLELSYGKYNNKLIIGILRNMKNKGKLIKYPELFTDDGTKLYEYVSLRKQIDDNNINYVFNYELSIDDEIKEMKNEINNNNSNIIETSKEQASDFGEQKMFLNKGKRQREEEEDNDNDDIKNDNSEIKKKKYEPNYLKPDNNLEKTEKKEVDTYNVENNELEKVQFISRAERLERARKRVNERFNINWECCIKTTLRNILIQLEVDDPIYDDVLVLIQDCYIKY